MVKNHHDQAKVQTSYYIEPGKTLENSKISERKLLLIAPRSEYKRLIDYTNQSERMAIIAEKERSKLSAMRKATYEMSKNWDNTNENVKKRRQEELLSKRKLEDEIRAKFAKEIAVQNAAAKAQVVKEARRLLLYKKPQCRLLNGALLTSECFRERDAQLAFEKTLQGHDEQQEKEYAEILKKEAEASAEKEHQKALEQWRKNKVYGDELKKQIEEKKNDLKRLEREEYLAGRQDLINMARDLRMMKECEDEQKLNRKNELKKLVEEAIEEKKRFEMEAKMEMEFCDRALKIFETSKRRIASMKKSKEQEDLQARMRHAEYVGKKFIAAASKKRTDDENASIAEAQREMESKALEMIEAKKQRASNAKLEFKKMMEEAENEQRKAAEERKELNDWETLQRFKKDEFNKEFENNQKKLGRQKKMDTAKDLRKQMLENEQNRIREKKFEDDNNSATAIIERTNKKVLEYGEQILNESKGIRPLFPILKTIEKYKIENGLIPRKNLLNGNNILAPVKKPKKRTPLCLAPVPEKEVVYL